MTKTKRRIVKYVFLLLSVALFCAAVFSLFRPWAILEIPELGRIGYGLFSYETVDSVAFILFLQIFSILSFLAATCAVALVILRTAGVFTIRRAAVRYGVVGVMDLFAFLSMLFAVLYVASVGKDGFTVGPGAIQLFFSSVTASLLLLFPA